MSLTSLGPTSSLLGSRRGALSAGQGLSSSLPSSAASSSKPLAKPSKLSAAPAKKLGGGLGDGLSAEPSKAKKGGGAKKGGTKKTVSAAQAAAQPRKPASGSGGLRDPMALTLRDDDDDDLSFGGDDSDLCDAELASESDSDVPELPSKAAPIVVPKGAPSASRGASAPSALGGGASLNSRRDDGDNYGEDFDAADDSGDAAGWGGAGAGPARKKGVAHSLPHSSSGPTLPSQLTAKPAPSFQRQQTQPLPAAAPTAAAAAGARNVGFDIPSCPFRACGGGGSAPSGDGGERFAAASTAPTQATQSAQQFQLFAHAPDPALSASLSALSLENSALKARIDSLMRDAQLGRDRAAAEHSAAVARVASAHEAELRRLETQRQRHATDAQLREAALRQELDAARADGDLRARQLQAESDAVRRERDQTIGRAHEEARHSSEASAAEAVREREAASVREAETRASREELARVRAAHAEEIRRRCERRWQRCNSFRARSRRK
ncbi:hypothetical protein T492DRAFT_917240 [Pavlovales sp. CCMP2436]|nr:hypothetical protein T492DRAFT_917240 [Pavlovales sp. CCMP2436]